ncbi:unnamed protein product [Linum trigynum]|uniref:Uncharacterized protein n=1 Tax=Linum trigynum TaxID=586398 RepID=A0AAV2FZJ9_9ROSI
MIPRGYQAGKTDLVVRLDSQTSGYQANKTRNLTKARPWAWWPPNGVSSRQGARYQLDKIKKAKYGDQADIAGLEQGYQADKIGLIPR